MDVTLYKYMPLRYLSSLLEDGLYLALASRFQDEWEGYFPTERVHVLAPDFEHMAHALGEQADTELRDKVFALMNRFMADSREGTFVDCWHENDQFSQFMWDEYAKGGVYVKTTGMRMHEAIPTELSQLFEYKGSQRNPLLMEISYRESLDDLTSKEAHRTLLERNAYWVKLDRFLKERERRLIIKASKYAVLTGTPLANAHPVKGIEELQIETRGRTKIHEVDGELAGLSVWADPKILVAEVGLVGESNEQTVRELFGKYGIVAPIRRLDAVIAAASQSPL
ncbi:hypothetical protein [Paraburkholderia aspalathi]|uniref:DUF2971 domain-containing protein n=1 Tax=Paraburkholderia aspalathi TaxID=1324617 RepID=A0A1I7EPM7_9BURK|nr:hypothetical protein [Paraburkholderia aspalathi]SFU25872.1 hypothetical protein SAMN05192563_10437 [Paraburkholderia aspalathi]